MSAKSDKLAKVYRQRFGDDAPGACFYYDTSYSCWMWNYKSPQNIGRNFNEAMQTVKASAAIAILINPAPGGQTRQGEMMITLNDLINGTAVDAPDHIQRLFALAVDAPDHIQRLFALAEEGLTLEGKLEAILGLPASAGGGARIDHIWDKAVARTARRVDRLDAAIQNFNDEVFVVEVMIVCGS